MKLAGLQLTQVSVRHTEEEPRTKQTVASTDLGRLNAFIRIWDTEGEMKASPSGQPVKFKATDL